MMFIKFLDLPVMHPVRFVRHYPPSQFDNFLLNSNLFLEFERILKEYFENVILKALYSLQKTILITDFHNTMYKSDFISSLDI